MLLLHCPVDVISAYCCAGEFFVAVRTPDDVSNFTRGDNVTLLCDVSGDVTDDMHITWSKDGDVVIDSDRSVVEDSRLTLYDVTTEDSGEYTCEALRRLQQADATLTVTVHGMLYTDLTHFTLHVLPLIFLELPRLKRKKYLLTYP